MIKVSKIFTVIFSIFTWIALSILTILAIYTIGANISVFNGYHSYLVQSGSMEPTIHINDVIITHSQSFYNPQEIITFNSPEMSRVVTHRITEIVKNPDTQFITKGDANREKDDAQITASDIIGKVIFVIPKLGFLINFSQSGPGLIILILIPAAGLIFDEIIKITAKKRDAA